MTKNIVRDPTELVRQSWNRFKDALPSTISSIFPIHADGYSVHCVDVYDDEVMSVADAIRSCSTYSREVTCTVHVVKEATDKEPAETTIHYLSLGEIPDMVNNLTFLRNGKPTILISQLERAPGIYLDRKNRTSLHILPERGPWLNLHYNEGLYYSWNAAHKYATDVSVLLMALGLGARDLIRMYSKPVEVHVTKTQMTLGGKRATRESLIGLVSYDDNEAMWANSVIDGDALDTCVQDGVESFEVIDWDTVKGPEGFLEMLLDQYCESDIAYRTHAMEYIWAQRTNRGTKPPSAEKLLLWMVENYYKPGSWELGELGAKRILSETGKEVPTTGLTIELVLKLSEALYEGNIRPENVYGMSSRRIQLPGEIIQRELLRALADLQREIKGILTNNPDGAVYDLNGELKSNRRVTRNIKRLFGDGNLCQPVDNTNPLASLAHKLRVQIQHRGGDSIRRIHPGQYNRVSLIETPDSRTTGMVLHLTFGAKVQDDGQISYPASRKPNGKGKIVEVDPLMEKGKVIAYADQDTTAERVVARVYNPESTSFDPTLVPKAQVDAWDLTHNNGFGVTTNLIPGVNHNEPTRVQLGSNMQRQAVPVIKSEPPLVGTGYESLVARLAQAAEYALSDGIVTGADSHSVTMSPDLAHMLRGLRATRVYGAGDAHRVQRVKPRVRIGQRVSKGDLLADYSASQLGLLSLGRNLRVAFMTWDGYNFEDAIAISERVIEEEMFTSLIREEYTCYVHEGEHGNDEVTCELPNVAQRALNHLDEYGIVQVGFEVKEGDILVGKLTPKEAKILTPEDKLMKAIFGDEFTRPVRDTSLRVPMGVSGTVVDVEVISGVTGENNYFHEYSEDSLARLTTELNEQLERSDAALLVQMREELGWPDLSFKDAIQRTKWNDNPEAEAFFKKVRKARSAQRKEAKRLLKAKKKEVEGGAGFLEAGVLTEIRVSVLSKRRLQVGDKLTGRLGNKGIVSIIVPTEDMPHDESGEPVDVLLSPLGVPSRMNIGQIHECLFGEVGWKLGQEVRKAHQRKPESNPTKLLKNISGYCHAEPIQKLDGSIPGVMGYWPDGKWPLPPGDMVDWVSKHGVPITMPVFDLPDETGKTMVDKLPDCLEAVGLPRSGQTRLWDGRTGQEFDRPVTVGRMYLYKLHHMVEDKVHARSIGPYAAITHQPLGGRSSHGGQKLGEMEVWALEAYGASKLLQEMLTVKSDDVKGRAKLYRDLLTRGGDVELGESVSMPSSVDVLLKELQGLGLDLRPDHLEGLFK